jgi:hypothetical protein
LTHGPTSARFAVVNYDADAGVLEPLSEWNEQLQQFVGLGNRKLDQKAKDSFAFHQVNVGAP